jgi:hypothetical protein
MVPSKMVQEVGGGGGIKGPVATIVHFSVRIKLTKKVSRTLRRLGKIVCGKCGTERKCEMRSTEKNTVMSSYTNSHEEERDRLHQRQEKDRLFTLQEF